MKKLCQKDNRIKFICYKLVAYVETTVCMQPVVINGLEVASVSTEFATLQCTVHGKNTLFFSYLLVHHSGRKPQKFSLSQSPPPTPTTIPLIRNRNFELMEPLNKCIDESSWLPKKILENEMKLVS